MHGYDFVGLILKATRQGGTEGRRLADVLKESSPPDWEINDRIFYRTDASFLANALIGLVSNGLITMSRASPNDIGEKIVSSIDDGYSHDTYRIVTFLQEQGVDNIVVAVTPKLWDVQELLRFSVTDMIEAARGGTIRIRPFFGEPNEDPALKSDVFVLMPFAPELRPVYEDHIQAVCSRAGLSCRRADDFFRVGQIMTDVWSAIFLADWIIADCTGRNPNVFYEMGIAHTMGKRTILITQHQDDVPFDIRHVRFFKYEYTPRGMKKLEDALASTLAGTAQ